MPVKLPSVALTPFPTTSPTMKLLILAFAALVSSGYAAIIRIYEASSDSAGTGEALPAEVTLCPDDLFGGVFTIECVPDEPTASVTFMVDGTATQTEMVVPYVLTGDNGGFATPWDYPMKATVTCMASNGEKAESMITYDCGGDMSPMPEPEVPAPEPTPPAPTKTPMPEEMEPKQEPKQEPAPPAAEPAPPAPQPAPAGDGSPTCVKIPATSYVSKSGEWVKMDGGMSYKMGDSSTGTDSPGTATLEYKFKAPKSGRYVISLDMKTMNGVDYNDVWVEFPAGGVSLEKPGSKDSSADWVKAYHNDNGRSVAAFSIDFDPHVISTKASLNAGQEYTINIGGRSTQVTLYAIVMFDCSGEGCMASEYYNMGINKCQ